MPFEIAIQGGIFRARLFGVVTGEDLVRFADEAGAMEDAAPAPMDRVADITEVESFEITYSDVLALAIQRRARRFDRPVRSALIAREPVEVGFARMFQTLNDNPQIEMRVVEDLEEALRWFAERGAGDRAAKGRRP
ncbi:MAG TPA: hypothetical protein VID50_07590 [Candidatus Eisenbacteria bacterium]|jgi:hypothetical protein